MKRFFAKPVIAVWALVGAGVLLAGAYYATQMHVKPVGKATLAVSVSPLSSPFFVAESLGYFEDEGLDATILPCLGGHKCFLELLNGQADFATSSDSVVMFNSFSNPDAFEVLTTFVKSSNDVKLVSLKPSEGSYSKQLMGKRVGVIKGSASEYFLHLYLLIAGISYDQLSVVYGTAPSLSTQLINGDIDMAVLWEPYIYQAHQALPELYILDTSGLYDLSFNLLTHAGPADEATQAKQLALLRALIKATQYINEEPKAAQKIIYQRLRKTPDFIEWIWPDLRFQLTLDYGLLSELESQARWAMETGIVNATEIPDYLQVLNGKPLAEVAPDTVTLQ